MVKVGIDCVDNDEPIFKLTIFKIKPSKQYALVMSMSHIIGDGSTYYEFMSMLDSVNSIRSLDAQRYQDTLDAAKANIHETLNPDNIFGICSLFGIFVNVFIRPPLKPHLFYIDENALKDYKESFISESVAYVSSNDVLVSWFVRFLRATLVSMAMGLRGRISGLDNNNAGNYIANVLFRSQDVDSPEKLRKILSSTPYIGSSKISPRLSECLLMTVVCTTNWSTFCKEISINDDKQILHIPLMQVSNMPALGSMIILNQKRGHLQCYFGVEESQISK